MADRGGGYTASSWLGDFLAAELGEIIGDCTSFIPAPVWVTKGSAAGLKLGASGLTLVIPERPKFVELPGIPYTLGLTLDYHSEIFLGQDNLHSGEAVGWFADELLCCNRPSGIVILWPGFYARDP